VNSSINTANKRIAIFLPGLYDGGAERVMLNLAAGLIRHGYLVDLVLVQAEGPYMNEIPRGVRLVELNKKHLSSQRTVFSLPSLVGYIRREKPDAMLSALNFANVIAFLAKIISRVPFRLVISEQNTFSSEIAQFPWYLRWILIFLMKLSYPKVDKITAVSEGVAEDLAQVLRIDREKISVIYNPVISPEIKLKKEEAVDDAWFGNNNPPVVLATGRLTKQKGFDILIQAFAQVRKQRLVHLLILGEGEDRQALLNLIRELDIEQDVRLPGFVKNPYPYMANASLFVLSSRFEGLPTVLVEALYCGTRLVATDCPSGPREILKNGLYGQLVPVDNVESLQQAILTSLDLDKTIPSPVSWQAYDLDTVIDQYVEALIGNN
jgi:glycosyltransferase involved in cell wall biosynthesis